MALLAPHNPQDKRTARTRVQRQGRRSIVRCPIPPPQAIFLYADDTTASEIPGIKAVHFLLHDHLDRSYNASSTYDGLGKNVCEYLRAKHVEVPNKFLRRGRV